MEGIENGQNGFASSMVAETGAKILCCSCGMVINSALTGGTAMCNDCISLSTDITEGIPRECNIQFCRNCERYLQPPNQWVVAELESKELLAILIRKLRGLTKVRLVDASYIWTEAHSRRIKLKVTVQGEALQGTILQQSFEIEYVVVPTQCPDCAKSFTTNTWRACVQVRQKVPHKRTFLYLEQLILKHNAHRNTMSIKEAHEGLDFFFAQRQHAIKLIDFLSTSVPIRSKKSEELISMDTHTNAKSYKFTYSVEIVPVCKDDLIVIPKKLARSLSNISTLVLCQRVSNLVHFIDPFTLQKAELSSQIFWRYAFPPLLDTTSLIEFTVLDMEPTGVTNGKLTLADATVMRSVDLGKNDNTYYVKTHLGAILHPGDTVLGYFLSNSNFNNELYDLIDETRLPDVVLVKKHYERRNKNKNRNWKLKRIAKEYEDNYKNSNSKSSAKDEDRVEQDYELFLQELEEDKDLRSGINMYKAKNTQSNSDDAMQGLEDEFGNDISATAAKIDISDDDLPEVGLDELLDELDEMTLEDKH